MSSYDIIEYEKWDNIPNINPNILRGIYNCGFEVIDIYSYIESTRQKERKKENQEIYHRYSYSFIHHAKSFIINMYLFHILSIPACNDYESSRYWSI